LDGKAVGSECIADRIADGQDEFAQQGRATAAASIGSDFPRVPIRAWLVSFVGTPTTCCLALGRSG
jgi:hypothetical protein